MKYFKAKNHVAKLAVLKHRIEDKNISTLTAMGFQDIGQNKRPFR
jgi:hypothetical protein